MHQVNALTLARLFVRLGPAARDCLRPAAVGWKPTPLPDPTKRPARTVPTLEDTHRAGQLAMDALARAWSVLQGAYGPPHVPDTPDAWALAQARHEAHMERLFRAHRAPPPAPGVSSEDMDAAAACAERFGERLFNPADGACVMLRSSNGWAIARRFVTRKLHAPPVHAPAPARYNPALEMAPHAMHQDVGAVADGGASWSRSHAKRFQPDLATKLVQAEGYREHIDQLARLPDQATTRADQLPAPDITPTRRTAALSGAILAAVPAGAKIKRQAALGLARVQSNVAEIARLKESGSARSGAYFNAAASEPTPKIKGSLAKRR